MSYYSIFETFMSSYESLDFYTEWIQEGAVFFPSTSAGREAINKSTTIMSSRIDLYKEYEKEQMVVEFTEDRILLEVGGRIVGKNATGILECGCYIRSGFCLMKVC